MLVILGWIGTIFIVVAYGLLKRDIYQHDHPILVMLNIFGSLFVAISAIPMGLYNVVILQLVWICITVYSINRDNVTDRGGDED